ncbi:hypothetical protein D3C85_1546000 [compost metagenome]
MGRELHHADGENHPAEQDIPQPVGGNTQRENARDSAARQSKARIEAIAHPDTAHPGAERQIKRIANKRHQHHLALREFMPTVGATQQVVAAVDQVADDH